MSEKKEPLLGLALILLSMEKEEADAKKDGFRYVLEGAMKKLGYNQKQVKRYLNEKRNSIELLWQEQNGNN